MTADQNAWLTAAVDRGLLLGEHIPNNSPATILQALKRKYTNEQIWDLGYPGRPEPVEE